MCLKRSIRSPKRGPRIEEFLKKIFGLAGFQLALRRQRRGDAASGFRESRSSGPLQRLRRRSAAGQQSRAAAGARAIDHGSAGHASGGTFARMLRRQRLPRSAHRRAAHERSGRGRTRQENARMPFHFSPMNSRERRILHLALRDQTEVRSESVGMGPIRQVVVVPADMKTLPEPIVRPAAEARRRSSRAAVRTRSPWGPSRRRRVATGIAAGGKTDRLAANRIRGMNLQRHDRRRFHAAGARRHRDRADFGHGCASHRRKDPARAPCEWKPWTAVARRTARCRRPHRRSRRRHLLRGAAILYRRRRRRDFLPRRAGGSAPCAGARLRGGRPAG